MSKSATPRLGTGLRDGRAGTLAGLAVLSGLVAALTAFVAPLGLALGATALVVGALGFRRRRRPSTAILAAAGTAMGAYAIALAVLGLDASSRSGDAAPAPPPAATTNDDEPVPPGAAPPPRPPPPTAEAPDEPEERDGRELALLIFSPVVGALGAGGGALVTRRERRTTRHLRDTLRRFVPEAVADELLEAGDAELRLGGIETAGTVMFTDIRGFTTFSESRPACDVIGVLNRYLAEMTDAILDHGGTLVSYSGDGIMAVFGAPVEQDDHADRALAATREILDQRLPRFNEWLGEQGVAQGFRIGVGLNSGRFVSGNVGSERRVEYTAIGDTINAAARLEELTKRTSYALLLSDAVRRELRVEPADLVRVGEFELRGRRGRTEVWSLSSFAAPR